VRERVLQSQGNRKGIGTERKEKRIPRPEKDGAKKAHQPCQVSGSKNAHRKGKKVEVSRPPAKRKSDRDKRKKKKPQKEVIKYRDVADL